MRLVCDELIGLAKEDLRRQIAALLAAQTTLDRDRLERELADTGRDISTAAIAGDDELLAICRPLEHAIIIGEE